MEYVVKSLLIHKCLILFFINCLHYPIFSQQFLVLSLLSHVQSTKLTFLWTTFTYLYSFRYLSTLALFPSSYWIHTMSHQLSRVQRQFPLLTIPISLRSKELFQLTTLHNNRSLFLSRIFRLKTIKNILFLL